MRNMNMCAWVLWMLFAVALMSTMAKGSGMEFVLIQEDGAYSAEFVAEVTGGVSVEM